MTRTIETVQDVASPEMSLILFNMSADIRFDEGVQDRLDSITEDFFVEVLREDLS